MGMMKEAIGNGIRLISKNFAWRVHLSASQPASQQASARSSFLRLSRLSVCLSVCCAVLLLKQADLDNHHPHLPSSPPPTHCLAPFLCAVDRTEQSVLHCVVLVWDCRPLLTVFRYETTCAVRGVLVFTSCPLPL